MEFKFTKAKWVADQEGAWLMLLAPDKKQIQEFVLSLTDKLYTCTIKQYRAKRSLDANAYAWTLITKIADVMRGSKDEVYLTMLKRYGQSSVVSVIEEAADIFKRSVKYWEDFGEADLNGKHFIHIKVFMGSSEFDTKQMAILIDGIVSECKELNIETMTPSEIDRLKGEWNK